MRKPRPRNGARSSPSMMRTSPALSASRSSCTALAPAACPRTRDRPVERGAKYREVLCEAGREALLRVPLAGARLRRDDGWRRERSARQALERPGTEMERAVLAGIEPHQLTSAMALISIRY